MYFLNSKTNNPYLNIATEDYLLHYFDDDFFFLYVDQPSVICGKHQNALAEINHQYITENNIPLIRRLSGGGTVYHDLGNLNFCFILNVENGKQIDFKRHTTPMITALKKIGINAELGIRNDILINGKKVSGNAEHVRKNRVLHHGTLLFNSDIKQLNESIKVDLDKFQDKAVKSKRSEVVNINSFLSQEITFSDFVELISDTVSKEYNLKEFNLKYNDEAVISTLITQKYQTWDWNYGYSPKYEFVNDYSTSQNNFTIKLLVANGSIIEANFSTNNKHNSLISSKLIGVKHEIESLKICSFINLSPKEIQILFFNHK